MFLSSSCTKVSTALSLLLSPFLSGYPSARLVIQQVSELLPSSSQAPHSHWYMGPYLPLADGAPVSYRRPLTPRPHQTHTRTARIPARHSAPHHTLTAQASMLASLGQHPASIQNATPRRPPQHRRARPQLRARRVPRTTRSTRTRPRLSRDARGRRGVLWPTEGCAAGTSGVLCVLQARVRRAGFRAKALQFLYSSNLPGVDVGAPTGARRAGSQDPYHALPPAQMAACPRCQPGRAPGRRSPPNRANARSASSNAGGTAPSRRTRSVTVVRTTAVDSPAE